MCCDTEAGSCLRLIDSCTTQLKAQGPSRTCNESKEEEEDSGPELAPKSHAPCGGLIFKAHRLLNHSTLGLRIIKKKKSPDGKRRAQFMKFGSFCERAEECKVIYSS